MEAIPKHLLVPVDMSDPSARALRYASAWALATGGRLSVLLVEEYEFPAYVGPETQAMVERVMDSERRFAKERLESFALPLVDAAAKPRFFIDRGPAADRILRQAVRLGADAIVMGTHGRSGLRRLLLGSVTEEVVRQARVPVLTVRAVESEAGVGGHSPWRPERLLVPADARKGSSAVVAGEAAALARAFGSSLVFLACYEPQAFASIDDETGRAEERARFFDRLPKALRPELRDLLLRGGDTAAVAVEEAGALRADLVVVGMGRRPFAGGSVLGVEAIRVLRHAPCPVLVVPEEKAAARRHSHERVLAR